MVEFLREMYGSKAAFVSAVTGFLGIFVAAGGSLPSTRNGWVTFVAGGMLAMLRGGVIVDTIGKMTTGTDKPPTP